MFTLEGREGAEDLQFQIVSTEGGSFLIDNLQLQATCTEGVQIANVWNTHDYYPFGMVMPGRNYQGNGDYRYGFNGMEKDDAVKGKGNHYTTRFRQYDPRIARWMSMDPLDKKFPWQSPYVAMDNNPVSLNDVLGDSTKTTVVKYEGQSSYNSETNQVTVTSTKQIRTEIYGPEKNGHSPWLGTMLETVSSKVVIDGDGEVLSSSTTTSYLGWDRNGGWDMSSSGKTSTSLKDAPKGTQGLVAFEAGFIKENGWSTHQYTADYASRRNRQNNREFMAAIPLKTIDLATSKTVVEVLLWSYSTGLDYGMSPNAVYGASEENPDKIIRHVEWEKQ